VQRAHLSLSRTTLVAPFNAFVQMERVDLGQLVGPQSQLATLVGTDTFWVQVSIPLDKLPYVKLPQGDNAGSHARVWIDTGQGRIEREGRVIRLLGDLDPVGRMARLVVEVQDPFGLKPKTSSAESGLAKPTDEMDAGSPTPSALPLLLGSFVHVDIEGKRLDQVVEIPRRALRSDNTVWLLNSKDELTIKSVRVVWSTSRSTIIRGSLATGDRVIVSRLGGAVSGMKLRVMAPAPATTTSRRGQ
jgi:multidrug efflux pump subunit AcrA (membrane-fusion protein)